MKRIAFLTLVALTLVGCGGEETAETLDVDQAAVSMATDEQLYIRAAENLVGQYGRALRTELTSALDENGVAYALQVCNLRAPGIMAAHSHGGWSIKRVSEKWRSIQGRPDTSEVAILRTLADPATEDNHLFRWSGLDSALVFHFYRKITVIRLCMQCHGDLQTVDLDLWKKVKIAYPYDKATGYKEGDLRGMFVVEAPYPEGLDMARLLDDGVEITQLTAVDSATADSTAGDTLAGDTLAGDTLAGDSVTGDIE